MELSVSIPHYHYPYPNPKPTTTSSLKPPHSQSSSSSSNQLRRPKTITTTPPPPTKPIPKIPSNPFKNLTNSTHVPTPPLTSSLTNKLWLTSKLSPPPPDIEEDEEEEEEAVEYSEPNKKKPELRPKAVEFRQEGKIFVGNLPNWIKKNEVSDFFRQFGPITNVILIKGHDSTERNAGFGFVIYGGANAMKSAMKAVEFDGVEFHGRVLTVKLDDGGRLKEKAEQRTQWIEQGDSGGDRGEFRARSMWHKERQSSRNALRKVMETEPENWQAVVRTFESIKKVLLAHIACDSYAFR